MTTTLSIIKIVESTSVDGPGLRTSVYCAGCSHHCPGCHNPQSWDISAGIPADIEQLATRLALGNSEDITFTGGDPLFQAEGFGLLAELVKSLAQKNIWCYTGYRFEDIAAKPRFERLLRNIDVLVDGRFVMEERDADLLFRGSRNQRIIDVARSLATGTATALSLDSSSPLLAGIKKY